LLCRDGILKPNCQSETIQETTIFVLKSYQSLRKFGQNEILKKLAKHNFRLRNFRKQPIFHTDVVRSYFGLNFHSPISITHAISLAWAFAKG